jgi:hypothetical protein
MFTFESLRANGGDSEFIINFPFVLSLPRHAHTLPAVREMLKCKLKHGGEDL